MILLFGGTTEGRMAARLLDMLKIPFFYSTKLGAQPDVPGIHISGEKSADLIKEFCTSNKIRLLVDAAHPFAVQLHTNIALAAAELGLKVVRVERRSPELRYPGVRFFQSYNEMADAALEMDDVPLLALTGVQTIVPLKRVWESRQCYFRILNTTQSEMLAQKSGINGDLVIRDSAPESADALRLLVNKLGIKVILTKDSGYSGGLDVKLSVARLLGIPLWVLKRPVLPLFDYLAYDRKELLMLLLRLKKELLATDTLATGFTTGTCVCAAAKAAIVAIEEQQFPDSVTVYLSDGTPATFAVFPCKLESAMASCTVVKDAGDDPDVTHGKEVGCAVYYTDNKGISFRRGEGVGLVTLPGLQVGVGEPAINPGPRRMVAEMVMEMSLHYSIGGGFIVEPFVPEGEELAKRTFNERVGVEGGISILGTTGRVYPYSAEAFLGAIREQVRVARSLGCDQIVITSGKRSEVTLRPLCADLPSNAFIHFGNFVGETLKIAGEEGIARVMVGVMLGKAVKLAEGNLDTHSREVLLNPAFMADVALSLGYPLNIVAAICELKLANAIVDIIPFGITEPFYVEIAERCRAVCRAVNDGRTGIRLALIVGEHDPIVVE